MPDSNVWSKEQTIDYAKDHPDITAKELVQLSGRNEQSCRSLLGQARNPNCRKQSGFASPFKTNSEPDKDSLLSKAVNADDFIGKYDLPQKVRDALRQLRGRVILDGDFRITLNVDTTRWSRVRELPEFKDFQIEIKRKLYWAWPDTIQEITKKLNVL